MIVNTLLRETSGKNLKVEIHFDKDEHTYAAKYFINGSFQSDRLFGKTDRLTVESAVREWIDSVGVLKG